MSATYAAWALLIGVALFGYGVFACEVGKRLKRVRQRDTDIWGNDRRDVE